MFPNMMTLEPQTASSEQKLRGKTAVITGAAPASAKRQLCVWRSMVLTFVCLI